MRIRSAALVAVLLLVAGACGDSSDTTTAATEAAAAAQTPPDVFDVTFDGSVCTVDGPSSIPASDQIFVVTNTVGPEPIPLYVVALIDGHTMQDLADMQAASGGPTAFIPMPEWAVYALRSFGVPELALAANQQLYGFSLDAGTHAIFLRGDNPSSIFLCAPLDVVVS